MDDGVIRLDAHLLSILVKAELLRGYTPTEEKEEVTSSTRSGTVYNDEGRKEYSKILSENLKNLTLNFERNGMIQRLK